MLFLAWVLGIFLHAASASAVAFTPTVTDVAVMPGEQASADFTIVNTSDATKEYVVSLYDVTLHSSLESPQFAPLPEETSSWLSVDTYGFTLAPSATRVLLLTATPLQTLTPQSATVGLVVRELSGDNGIAVASGVTSLVFITVGNPETDAVVDVFSVTPRVTSTLNVTVAITVVNGGDRVVQPYGTVQLRTMFGTLVDEVDVNPSLYRVPTNDQRVYTVRSGDDEHGGFFDELWREIVQHRVGVFTARLVAAPYPGADTTLSATTRFVVFPWRSAVVLLVLCGGVTVAWRKRRS